MFCSQDKIIREASLTYSTDFAHSILCYSKDCITDVGRSYSIVRAARAFDNHEIAVRRIDSLQVLRCPGEFHPSVTGRNPSTIAAQSWTLPDWDFVRHPICIV